MNDRTTSGNAWQTFRSVYWTLAAAMAIVLVLLAVLGFGPGGRNCQPVGAATPGVASGGAATAAGGSAALAVNDAAPRYACMKG